MIEQFYLGWDVGGWNCDKNALSRDALVLLNAKGEWVGCLPLRILLVAKQPRVFIFCLDLHRIKSWQGCGATVPFDLVLFL